MPIQTNAFTDITEDNKMAQAIDYMWRNEFIPENDPDCPPSELGQRFCPDLPVHRINAAVFMTRAFGLTNIETQ